MSDLVERLRESAPIANNQLLREAADTIERIEREWWVFVRDAYEEGVQSGVADSHGLASSWEESETLKALHTASAPDAPQGTSED